MRKIILIPAIETPMKLSLRRNHVIVPFVNLLDSIATVEAFA